MNQADREMEDVGSEILERTFSDLSKLPRALEEALTERRAQMSLPEIRFWENQIAAARAHFSPKDPPA
jgi:hypothetical protein